MKTLILVGSTGLVGQSVLQQALANEAVGKVIALSRRPLDSVFLSNPKLNNLVVDFNNLPDDAVTWKADALICTLGTTIKQAGSAEKFREVDLHLVERVARLSARHGVHTFVLNSSTMANPKARGLYLRTKGEAEEAVKAAGFKRVVLARPGLLDGNRTEHRLGEEIGLMASRLVNPLLPKRYRSVKVEMLASVMLAHALRAQAGLEILESECFQGH